MSLVITPESLHSRLGKDDTLIVDTRSYADYSKCHIPGAVNVDLMQFHWLDTSPRGIKAFNKQSLRLLSNMGVSRKKLVVFYDNTSGSSAARGVWLLLYFSHRCVSMLDGGLGAWKSRGYKTEKKSNAFKPTRFRATPDRSVLARELDVKRAIRSDSRIIIDARSKDEYEGKVARGAHRGHIPGAINIDWTRNIKRSGFKDPRLLEEIYNGIPRDSEVITYCQGGYRAANTFVVLRQLGFKKVRMYLGSWGEWGNDPSLPFSAGTETQ